MSPHGRSFILNLYNIFHRQSYHFFAIFIYILILHYLDTSQILDLEDNVDDDDRRHRKRLWYYLASFSTPVHQIYVTGCWRTELYCGLLTDTFGKKYAFGIFSLGFVSCLLWRFVATVALAMVDSGSLIRSIGPAACVSLKCSAGVISILVLWTAHSTKKRFSFSQTIGIDHFDPLKYRNAGSTREGVFACIEHPFYWTGLFLGMFLPGILFESKAALAISFFTCAITWVHYFCTEKPDMDWIYGHGVLMG